MYNLTLTSSERKAIDWVGYRYSNGDDLMNLLCNCNYISSWHTSDAWNSDVDITFNIPEHIAWEIAINASNEDGDLPYNFPCFSDELTSKLLRFCVNII